MLLTHFLSPPEEIMTTLSINSCHICYYDAFLYACQITCYRDTFVVVVAPVLPRYLCYFATPSVTFATPFKKKKFLHCHIVRSLATLSITQPHRLLPCHSTRYPATSHTAASSLFTLPHSPLPRHVTCCTATFCYIIHISCYFSTSSVTLPRHQLL